MVSQVSNALSLSLRNALEVILDPFEGSECSKNPYVNVSPRWWTGVRDLRPSFIRSKIFGNMCCLFRQQKQHSKISLWTGAPREALWKTVGKVIFSLFDPKNHFSAFNGPINIAGGRLDILFHFPNDWCNSRLRNCARGGGTYLVSEFLCLSMLINTLMFFKKKNRNSFQRYLCKRFQTLSENF